MLGSPIDIAIIGVIALVIFGPKTMPPWGGKLETWEKNPNSPKDPFPKQDHDLFIK